MSLDTIGDAQKLSTEYQQLLIAGGGRGNNRLFLDTMQTILDQGFQLATPTIFNIDITTPAGTLFIPLGTPYEMPMNIGTACAEYWSKTIEITGVPEKNEILEVTNDASKIAVPIAEKIMHLSHSGQPYYFKFVDIIHKEIKTIVWTVKESDASGINYTFNPKVT